MKNIKTLEDVKNLKANNGLPQALLKHLEAFYQMLFQAFSDEENPVNFSLERHGYLVVLDSDDNLRDLHELGLNPKDGGLLGILPEYVELIPLDGQSRRPLRQ